MEKIFLHLDIDHLIHPWARRLTPLRCLDALPTLLEGGVLTPFQPSLDLLRLFVKVLLFFQQLLVTHHHQGHIFILEMILCHLGNFLRCDRINILYPVGEIALAQILPDVLGRVQLRAGRRQPARCRRRLHRSVALGASELRRFRRRRAGGVRSARFINCNDAS